MAKRKPDESIDVPLEITNPADSQNGATEETDPLPFKRKVTACSTCRKHKTKCEMPNDTPPCTRCARQGIPCILSKTIKSILDDQKSVKPMIKFLSGRPEVDFGRNATSEDVMSFQIIFNIKSVPVLTNSSRQSEFLQTDVRNIHDTLQQLCHHLNIGPPRPLVFMAHRPLNSEDQNLHSDLEGDSEAACDSSRPDSPSIVQAPIDTFLNIAKAGKQQAASTPHSGRHRRNSPKQDLISQGIISLEAGEALVDRYYSRLDYILYGIASHHRTLDSLRHASPALLAAVCTVSALHDPKDEKLYEACNREFHRIVSNSLFEKTDIDYIRALCIGSFWLADASRILLSDAIRRAADARLHRHFYRVINEYENQFPSENSSLSVAESHNLLRLWYRLFVLDQHLSVLHNRDGLLRHENDVVARWEDFLENDEVNYADVRIMSQVSLLLLMNSIRDSFRSEHPEQVHKSLAVQLNHFSRQLSKWFAKFSTSYANYPEIGEHQKRGLQMHYHFGKLYLGQQIFRGLKSDPIPPHFLTAASTAHEAAIAIFTMTVNDNILQESLIGRPQYFFIMIAFAEHFLLEVCKKYSEQLMINLDNDLLIIAKALAVFNNIPVIPQHPIGRMMTGLRRKLVDCATELGKYSALNDGTFPTITDVVPHTTTGILPQTFGSQTSSYNPFDFTAGHMMPPVDEFTYTDFGDYNFPDMSLNFLP